MGILARVAVAGLAAMVLVLVAACGGGSDTSVQETAELPTIAALLSPTQTRILPPTATGPTRAPVPSPTPSRLPPPTRTPVAAPTRTPVRVPTRTPFAAPTPTRILSRTSVSIPTATRIFSAAPTATPVPVPTRTPVAAPTRTPTPSANLGTAATQSAEMCTTPAQAITILPDPALLSQQVTVHVPGSSGGITVQDTLISITIRDASDQVIKRYGSGTDLPEGIEASSGAGWTWSDTFVSGDPGKWALDAEYLTLLAESVSVAGSFCVNAE